MKQPKPKTALQINLLSEFHSYTLKMKDSTSFFASDQNCTQTHINNKVPNFHPFPVRRVSYMPNRAGLKFFLESPFPSPPSLKILILSFLQVIQNLCVKVTCNDFLHPRLQFQKGQTRSRGFLLEIKILIKIKHYYSCSETL